MKSNNKTKEILFDLIIIISISKQISPLKKSIILKINEILLIRNNTQINRKIIEELNFIIYFAQFKLPWLIS